MPVLTYFKAIWSKMMKYILGMTTALVLASSAAYAQYTGPVEKNAKTQANHVATSVKEIQANPKDDQKVILEGTLLKKIGDDEYRFSDGTGEITVEIDEDDFPKTPVGAETKLKIHGEVDTHLLKAADIEADSVTVVK
jgi:uncharacterized protein (TIGR00156 family)